MGYLVRLKTLNLCQNMIKELPPDVTNMRCEFFLYTNALIINTKIIYILQYSLFDKMIIVFF